VSVSTRTSSHVAARRCTPLSVIPYFVRTFAPMARYGPRLKVSVGLVVSVDFTSRRVTITASQDSSSSSSSFSTDLFVLTVNITRCNPSVTTVPVSVQSFTITKTNLTESLAVAKRSCTCCMGQFWPDITEIRYFADYLQALYVSACRAVEFGEIIQHKSYYGVQGHSRSPISVTIGSPYATS